jgi:thiol peroxidase
MVKNGYRKLTEVAEKLLVFVSPLVIFIVITTTLAGCERSLTMQERKGVITMHGNPLTLVGQEVKVGQKAPDFTVVNTDLSPVTLSSFAGKVIVISTVPSLDTGVCDVMTRRFNEEAGKLGDDVVVLTISMDLPFAQKRWCGAAGATHVIPLSDYQTADFGLKYGLLIKELRLLTRAVLVIDRDGIVRYVQIVPEIATEPDYEAAIKVVKDLL